MYTIIVEDDHSLTVSKRERIMQRSKLVDNLEFLVPQIRKGVDMSTCTVQLEYVLPCSKRYCAEILQLSNEMYKDYLKYTLPFDTNLTSEAGQIQLHLTFAKTELDASGKGSQYLRKTSDATIEIIPISAWADIIPDSALTAIDQRLIKLDAQIRAVDEMNQVIINEQVDNIKYNETTNELQLMAGENEIGDKVILKGGQEDLKDGIPVVDFSSTSGGDTPSDEDDEDNVVEF